MPSPTSVHIDQALTNVSVKRRPQSTRFVATKIFPTLSVRKQSDLIWREDTTDERFKVRNTVRAPGAEAKSVDPQNQADLTYFCRDHSQVAYVPDEERDNADDVLRPSLDRLDLLQDIILLEQEVNAVAALDTILSDHTETLAADECFDNHSTGDPIGYLKARIQDVALACGVKPNGYALDDVLLSDISEHPDFIDRAKHVDNGEGLKYMSTARLLAAILNINEVVVSDAVAKNTAVDGASSSFTRVWNDTSLLYFSEPPRLGTSCLAIHPVWAGGWMVERWREEKRKSDAVVAHYYYDLVRMRSKAGFLIKNCAGDY